ncbi:hypothetical protein ACFQ41_05180 [Lacticaseibacillus suilingensis]|uniref:RNA polymerase sigma factor 70 region 4 type 2 domain-containing protein n=1 Tax=Lacticaseibacillus suilingensis TaxID=2799577 RepID=A0ABW4BGQ1_9LACO|nr:hypothetical protein [Lacticaseibacillus suilingensis]
MTMTQERIDAMYDNIHWCELKYGDLAKTPDNDEHLQKARLIASNVKHPVSSRAALTGDQVQTLVTDYMSGISPQDIAIALNVPIKTVRSRIYRMGLRR